MEAIMQCVNEQAAGFLITGAAHRVGPAFANYHLILARIKKALDPKNIANLTRLTDMERLEKPEK